MQRVWEKMHVALVFSYRVAVVVTLWSFGRLNTLFNSTGSDREVMNSLERFIDILFVIFLRPLP
jgi:hypothetical protein